jgi:hypothetical protein
MIFLFYQAQPTAALREIDCGRLLEYVAGKAPRNPTYLWIETSSRQSWCVQTRVRLVVSIGQVFICGNYLQLTFLIKFNLGEKRFRFYPQVKPITSLVMPLMNPAIPDKKGEEHEA